MMNKKAQLYTMMAILLIGFMFISFEVLSEVGQRHQIKTRISTMENFLNSVEQNLERQTFISGFRIIFLAEREITETGNYIPNTNDFFQEAFFNGTVNGNASDILLGATYSDLMSDLTEKADKINVNIVLTNPVLTVTQEDPWNVKATLTMDFTMQDQADLARWEKQQVITAYIPVEGFLDPAYSVNSNNLVLTQITRTPYSTFIPVSNLLNHTVSRYYLASSEAPNFLGKLEGNFSADTNGIESLVYIPSFSSQNLQTFDKSVVDHIYFSSSNPSKQSVSGMPSWFNLDPNHITTYTS